MLPDLNLHKKTRIICTIGPASNNHDVITRLIKNGMNIVRLNFSHGTLQEHAKTIELIRKTAAELGANISILQDLPGPKIRIGELDQESYQLKIGDTVQLTKTAIIGNNEKFSCSYPEVIDCLQEKDIIYLNDGIIELEVIGKSSDSLVLKVLSEGSIRSHKGLNVPSKNLTIDAVTAEDIEYLKFGLEWDLDFIAVSFVRKKEDILKIRSVIEAGGKTAKVIAKIENSAALDNIDAILEAADGIMVARGDLGIEVPIEDLALTQKKLIAKARKMTKPSIVATQMLRSMVENSNPTRAEVADISNAVLDGSDAVMLSEETAIGRYPVETCSMMNIICLRVERELDNLKPYKTYEKETRMYPELAVGYAAQDLVENLDIKALAVLTRSGKTAELISAIRINKPVLAFTYNEKIVRMLNLYWGVIPFYLPELSASQGFTAVVLQFIKDKALLPKDALILITSGTYNALKISTNMIELQSAL